MLLKSLYCDPRNHSVAPPPPHDPPPSPSQDARQPHTHKIVYKNKCSHNYKLDERILQQIIKNSTTCHNPEDVLQLITYDKKHTTTNLIIRNNQCPQTPTLKKLT